MRLLQKAYLIRLFMLVKKKIFKGGFYTLCLYILICIMGMQFYNGEKAANYATNHVLNKSHTLCAGFVMRALWSGHCYIGLYPAWAYKYILPLYGFKTVKTTVYRKGDIIVYPAVGKHIWGHLSFTTASNGCRASSNGIRWLPLHIVGLIQHYSDIIKLFENVIRLIIS